MIARLLAVAALATGLAVPMLTAAPAAAAPKKPIEQCMTDDGYGRFRPCSSLYKREHPNWKQGTECMTDDGYGRYRPCSSLYWQGGNGWAQPPQNPPKK
jgi:hypothetical protein